MRKRLDAEIKCYGKLRPLSLSQSSGSQSVPQTSSSSLAWGRVRPVYSRTLPQTRGRDSATSPNPAIGSNSLQVILMPSEV